MIFHSFCLSVYYRSSWSRFCQKLPFVAPIRFLIWFIYSSLTLIFLLLHQDLCYCFGYSTYWHFFLAFVHNSHPVFPFVPSYVFTNASQVPSFPFPGCFFLALFFQFVNYRCLDLSRFANLAEHFCWMSDPFN